MVQKPQKNKTKASKFPLTLHRTGQYCKKIRGKLYYFGADKHRALERYLEEAAILHAGRPRTTKGGDELSIKTLCNLYLDYQETRLNAGEIKGRHLYDQTRTLRLFVGFLGVTRRIGEITTFDFQSYRAKLIKENKAPNTINGQLSAIKAMFHWAIDNEIVATTPNLKAVKKIPSHQVRRQTFTKEQLLKLIAAARPKLKAMIWLGLNCGFGCTDCAELRWEHLDLKNGRVHYARGKTGIDRNLPLWPETIMALKTLPCKNEYVFLTKYGNPWVRVIQNTVDGTVKKSADNALGKEFSKLLKDSGIKICKGMGFYTLRRTAATWAAQSGDPFAVQRLLGHADLKMASTYVQDISEQTDRVINNNRRLISQGDS